MSITHAATPEREHNHVVRERVFLPAEFERVMLMLHESRATGTVMLDINQGGLCLIRFREEKKVTPP